MSKFREFNGMFRNVPSFSVLLGRGRSALRRCSTVGGSNVQKKEKDVLGIVFFSGICVVATGLGTWQVKRYFWKVDLINSIKNSAAGPAATIEGCSTQKEFADKAAAMKGQIVRMRGTFDYERELFLGLRSAPQSLTGGPAQGMASNPQGYYVITPYKRDDGCVMYVNRGWMPRNMYTQVHGTPCNSAAQAVTAPKQTSQSLPAPWDRPQGVVDILVAMSEGEKAGSFSPVNAANSNILLWLEPAALLRNGAGSSGTNKNDQQGKAVLEDVETMVVAEAVVNNDSDAQSFPHAKSVAQLQEQSVAPENHFVYAFTWFTLAAAGFFMTYLKFRRGGGGPNMGVGIKQKATTHASPNYASSSK